jgi:predicted small metal-binding protein
MKTGEVTMARKYIDCREFPSEMNCTLAISADSEKELLDAAVQHAVAIHGHKDTPEFRKQLRGLFKDGTPPLRAGRKK